MHLTGLMELHDAIRMLAKLFSDLANSKQLIE